MAAVSAAVACSAAPAPGPASDPDTTSGSTAEQRLLVAPYRAKRAGVLPEGGPATVGGIDLPAGHGVPVDVFSDDGKVAWVTDGAVPDVARVWSDLRRQFPTTGLWPLISDAHPCCGLQDPFDVADQTDPAMVDLESTLEGWWAERHMDEAGPEFSPFGADFPGLAAASIGPIDEDTLEDLVAEAPWYVPGSPAAIVLVPVQRPADVVWALRWDGPINYLADEGQLARVLRSWEDRFGAEPVWISADGLFLAARRPPTDEAQALLLAAEMYATCPDCLVDDIRTIPELADHVRGGQWGFWWD